jgi:hypothetical protein
MNKVLLAIALISGLAMGCDSTDLGGDGGMGGVGGAPPVIGPLLWTAPGLTIVGDTCDPTFLVDEALAFNITIQGSDVLMIDADPTANPATALQGSTDTYSPEDDVVRLTNTRVDDRFEESDGCVVELNDAFVLTLTDPDLSLDQNATVEVEWTNNQEDISDTAGACEGIWFFFNELTSCTAQATFTLTQDPAPEQ